MAAVDYIFDRVNKTLARKGQAGYSSKADFNGDSRDSENMLMEYYYKMYEETQKISDALYPFLEEEELSIDVGYIQYPKTYRHADEMSYIKIVADANCEKPVRTEIPMDKLQSNEERDVMQSFIRKPSLEKELYYWVQMKNRIRIRPMELTGKVVFKYFRNPLCAVYETKVNLVKQLDVFDRATSKDYEWNEQETPNLIDLILIHKGISIRDTDIINFAIQKMGYAKQ